MLTRSHSERRPLPGFSALLTYNTPKQKDETPSLSPSFDPLTSPTPWMAQALSNLQQGQQELQSLRDRQQAEVEEVNRELDNAAIEAQREERRLLEKIEQDHREAQRCLSQVRRENSAAFRVVQSLVDQQLRKIGQLTEQIQRWGGTAGGANKNQLQRGVAELTQPWEISLTLKRVGFLPNPLLKTVRFGEVDVREQGMTYPIGVCGIQGQKCALHSGDATFLNKTPVEIRKEPQSNRSGPKSSPEESNKSSKSSLRVVRKLHLSSSTETEEEFKSPKSPVPRRRGTSESSQDEEIESVCSDTQDLFLSIPSVSSQGESEGDDSDGRYKGRKKNKGRRRQRALVLVSPEEQSCPPEESSEKSRNVTRSPKISRKDSFTSLSSWSLMLSQQDISQKKTTKQSSVGSASPPLSVDSEDSCFAASLDQQDHRLAPTNEQRPSGHIEFREMRKVNKMQLASESPNIGQARVHRSVSEENAKNFPSGTDKSPIGNFVSRSQSVSATEGDKLHQDKEMKPNKQESEAEGRSVKELEDDGGSSAFDSAYMVKQFGKQGSGRTDFNLPSGVHATVRGQLFVVDCGNARIQVTDLQKNIVQQVSPSGSERSSRICNYFDVAVNSKGLIALTCAAERAVLVFSRHGRLLQTFGGALIGSTNEELDAPRGVTVTQQDEFLVADIKRGTLTTLKLDAKSGARLERTVVTGFHRPYLVAACLTTGLVAVSEKGNESGRVPCIRVLEPSWNTIRILGVCSGLGPVLTCPWGLCIDSDGDVLVADWGKQSHRVLIYPSKGVGWPVVTNNLNSPRGLALLPDGHVVITDSMNHCIKIYRYK